MAMWFLGVAGFVLQLVQSMNPVIWYLAGAAILVAVVGLPLLVSWIRKEEDKQTTATILEFEKSPLPVVDCPLHLQSGEVCHFAGPAGLVRHRTVGGVVAYHGPVARVQLAPGVQYRLAVFSGSWQGEKKWVRDTLGSVYVTNRRIIFRGSSTNASCDLSRIIELNWYENGVLRMDKASGPPLVLGGVNARLLAYYIDRLIGGFGGGIPPKSNEIESLPTNPTAPNSPTAAKEAKPKTRPTEKHDTAAEATTEQQVVGVPYGRKVAPLANSGRTASGALNDRSYALLATLAAEFGNKPFTVAQLDVIATPFPVSATPRMQNARDLLVLKTLAQAGLLYPYPSPEEHVYQLTEEGLKRAPAATQYMLERYPNIKSARAVPSTKVR
jgi:hypothetical protein